MALILIIIGAVFFILFPNFFGHSNMSITYYNAEGQEVHVPFGLVPYGVVTAGGQDIDTFTITINWYTNDPLATFVQWDVYLTVSYLYTDSPTEPPVIAHESLIWPGYSSEGSWDQGTGTMTSQQFDVHAYASSVPDDSTFYLEFTGEFRFYGGNIERMSEVLLFSGALNLKRTTCFKGSYDYEAWFGT